MTTVSDCVESTGMAMQPDLAAPAAARVLWTGGWDSTFQLLQLLSLERRPVVPYYLINEERPSTGIELLTMRRIRELLRVLDPEGVALLRPTCFRAVGDIAADAAVTRAYERVKAEQFIGSQYDWLARFCTQERITGLQLCIHEDDKAARVVMPMMARGPAGGHGVRMDEQYADTDAYKVFRHFEFPVLALTKREMEAQAERYGWRPVMESTWFCHMPRNNLPCGACSPCRYTIEEGLGRRIPWRARIRGRLALSLVQPVRHTLGRVRRRLRFR